MSRCQTGSRFLLREGAELRKARKESSHLVVSLSWCGNRHAQGRGLGKLPACSRYSTYLPCGTRLRTTYSCSQTECPRESVSGLKQNAPDLLGTSCLFPRQAAGRPLAARQLRSRSIFGSLVRSSSCPRVGWRLALGQNQCKTGIAGTHAHPITAVTLSITPFVLVLEPAAARDGPRLRQSHHTYPGPPGSALVCSTSLHLQFGWARHFVSVTLQIPSADEKSRPNVRVHRRDVSPFGAKATRGPREEVFENVHVGSAVAM